jgi:hypothetical protein
MAVEGKHSRAARRGESQAARRGESGTFGSTRVRLLVRYLLTETVDGDDGEKAVTLALHRATTHRTAFLEKIIVAILIELKNVDETFVVLVERSLVLNKTASVSCYECRASLGECSDGRLCSVGRRFSETIY